MSDTPRSPGGRQTEPLAKIPTRKNRLPIVLASDRRTRAWLNKVGPTRAPAAAPWRKRRRDTLMVVSWPTFAPSPVAWSMNPVVEGLSKNAKVSGIQSADVTMISP